MTSNDITARQEWARMWPLPIAAMLGVAGIAAFAYTHGIFLDAMTSEFGWTHAEFSSAFTFQMLIGLVLAPLVGRLVDRFGPRPVALAGLLPYACGLSALGLASGSVTQWQLLCVFQGATVALVGPPVWITAVVMRFNASRGLALATALAGMGVASMIWPLIGALLISSFGWRMTFPALALIYLLVMVPMALRCLPRREESDCQASAELSDEKTSGKEVLAALRSRALVCVVLAGALFSTVTLGLTFHYIPMLRNKGFDLGTAATAASLIGLASLIGRLGTGFLLDRMPVRRVGIFAFLLPTISAAILLQPEITPAMAFAAAIIFGLASGAETDVVSYLISRRFQHVFATVYAISFQIFGAVGSLGPLLAAAAYDSSGSYHLYISLIIPVVVSGAILIWMIPPMAPEASTARELPA